jgi:hypothetical protein
MDERQDTHRLEVVEDKAPTSHAGSVVAAAIIALVVAIGLGFGYYHQQQAATSQMASHENDLNATINQMQGQIDSLTTKLNQEATAPAAPAVNATQPVTDTGAARRRTAAVNKHFKQLESQLDDQQKALKDTQDQVAQSRADFQGNLDSTRDQLNGSIARTHDELVALEQKGERSYFEFDLTKAKHFQREGPIMVSLRRADPKHKNFDLAMIVDDNQLSKKHVNLFEPVWINGGDRQQVQLVVNKVDKDHVHGYVSAPKYNETASMTTVSDRTTTTSEPTRTSATPETPATTDQTGTTSDNSTTTSQQPQ